MVHGGVIITPPRTRKPRGLAIRKGPEQMSWIYLFIYSLFRNWPSCVGSECPTQPMVNSLQ